MIDLRPLTELCADLGEECTCAFVRNFLTMLDGRMARLRDALAAGDVEEAIVAAMSLHSSAVMVGAHELATAAADLLAQLRDGGAAVPSALPPQLPAVAAATSQALRELRAAEA